jgi:hypothetical protein
MTIISNTNPIKALATFIDHFLNESLDDLLSHPETAHTIIDDKQYKAEQDLAEKYRSFVSEILKLSLSGVAVFSYIYKGGFPACGLGWADFFALIGIGMFAFSACCALVFLYCASEGLRWYIAGLRFASLDSTTQQQYSQKGDDTNATVKRYLTVRDKWIHRCRWSKLLAAVLLGSGGIFVALAILLR